MPINSNIALGVQPVQMADPLAQYGKIAAIQGAQNQNALAQYQLSSAKRADETQNLLAKAYAESVDPTTGKIDYNKLTGLVASAGGGAQLPAIQKSRAEQETAAIAQQKAQADLVDAKLKQSRNFLDTINPADPNAPAQYIAWHEANHKDPVLGPVLAARGVTAEQARTRIMDAINKGPQAFATLVNQSKLGTEKFMEMNKPTTSVGPTGIVQIAGLGGPATVVQGTDAAFQMTPAQIEQAKRDQQRLALEGQRVNLEGQRVQLARQDSERKTTGLDALPPKEIQKREAAFPQATSAIKGFETNSDLFIKELIALRDDKGLDQITGPIYGRTPSVSREGSRAQASYNKIFAKGGFQALQDMRDASKTGGALGNVSNAEGERLERSVVGGLDRTQNVDDVKKGINDLIDQIQGSKVRMREAYDLTYSYKAGSTPDVPAAPAAPAASNVVVTPDGQSHTFPTPAAAAQFKKAAGIP
jgi:hypothetical protein